MKFETQFLNLLHHTCNCDEPETIGEKNGTLSMHVLVVPAILCNIPCLTNGLSKKTNITINIFLTQRIRIIVFASDTICVFPISEITVAKAQILVRPASKDDTSSELKHAGMAATYVQPPSYFPPPVEPPPHWQHTSLAVSGLP